MRVVVGAGPAGAMYAAASAENGWQVAVYEASREYRRPCGEAVPAHDAMHGWPRRIRSAWEAVLGEYVRGSTVYTLRSIALVYASKSGTIVDYRVEDGGEYGYIVDKKRLVEALRRRAEKAGAEIVYRAVSVREQAGRGAVVACGSCGRTVAKLYAEALVWQGYTDRSRLLDMLGVDAAAVFTPLVRGAGYVWAWRAGSGRVNYGAGWTGASPHELVEAARRVVGPGNSLGGGYSVISWVKPWRPGMKPVRIGEAGGMVTAMAEGIRPGMLHGYAAAVGDRELLHELYSLAPGRAELHIWLRLAHAMNTSIRVWRLVSRIVERLGGGVVAATNPPKTILHALYRALMH